MLGDLTLESVATLPRLALQLVQAFLDIGRDEGAAGYFRGLSAFMPRVVAYGAVQLSAYDWAKRQLHGRFSSLDGMPLQASAAFVAAILAVSANQPFDFVSPAPHLLCQRPMVSCQAVAPCRNQELSAAHSAIHVLRSPPG